MVLEAPITCAFVGNGIIHANTFIHVLLPLVDL